MATESENDAVQDFLRRESVITTGSNLRVPIKPHPGQLYGPDGRRIHGREPGKNITSKTRGKQQQ